MVRLGHKVTVLGVYPIRLRKVEDDEGVTVIRLPETRIRGAGFLINGMRIRRELREIDGQRSLDIVEAQENGLALLSGYSPGVKLIRIHGGHHFFATTLGGRPKAWRAWVERSSFSKADHICAVSRFVAAETSRLLGLAGRPIEILANPVDTKRFRPMPDVDVVSGRVIFVGTLCEKKGIRQLVDAMPRVLESEPNAELLVCGRDSTDKSTGKSFRSILDERMDSRSRGRIKFLDHVDNAELPRLLASGEVLAYPSHMEAFPVAWLEGLAMGKPLVASKTGPGPEAIEHGVSGLLCNPHSPEELASSILMCLRDRALSRRLGNAARDRAVREFDVEPIAKLNEAFYRLCRDRGGRE